jgi:hypothetical protein
MSSETANNENAPEINTESDTNGAPIPPHEETNDVKMTEPEFYIHIRGLIGPSITDGQRKELHEWTEGILEEATSSDPPAVRPSETLLSLLGDPMTMDDDSNWQSVICPVIQSCLVSSAVDTNAHVEGNTNTNGHGTSIAISTHAPLEFTFHSSSHPLPAASLHLYYTALERILNGHKSHDSRNMLLLNSQFHKSLYSLCHFCVVKAIDCGQSHFDMKGTGSCPIVYYKLIEAYLTEMTTVIPTYLTEVLRRIQEMMLDSLWSFDFDVEQSQSFGPSFIGMINKLRERPSCWPIVSLRKLCPIRFGVLTSLGRDESSKESMFVGYIVSKLLTLMERRYEALCREMSLLHENELSLSKANDVKEEAMTLFLSLMCYRIDIFFGRHPDQIMLCTLYIVCNKMKLAPKVR